jgi:hypothetical protein
MKNNKTIFAALVLCSLLYVTTYSQSGGSYAITQSVLSNGGGESSGGNFGVTGTTGQSFAGTQMTNGGFSVSGGFWNSPQSPSGSLPIVTTSPATSVTVMSATLNGSANPNGQATTGWFRYSLMNPGVCDNTFGTRAPMAGGTALGSNPMPVPYSEGIAGLNAGSTYYFCAIASNSSGTSFGSVLSFIAAPSGPSVTTNAATSVTVMSATLNGTANPNSDATTGWFRYSSFDPGACNDMFGTRAPIMGGSALGSGVMPAPYSEAIGGLNPGTQYYFCAIASNSFGNSFGSVLSFVAAPGASVSGTITYGNAISNPTPPRFVRNVSLSSTSGMPPVGPVLTGTPGTYTLTGFGAGSYTIKPTKPGGPNAAINSFDAARVAQGVAGTIPFVSQNQRFVSDASGNGSVTSNDAALIAKFAAGLGGAGNVAQWKFFVTGAPSPLPTSPQTYNDSRTYPMGVTSSVTGEDFVGLLVGEASGNYNPATHPRGTVVGGRMSDVGEDGRAAGKSITVTVQNVATVADQEVVIPVRVEGMANSAIISYEFNIRYDPTVLQPRENPVDVAGTVSRGLIAVDNPSEPGLLRVVVYGPMPIDRDGLLLELRFLAVGRPGSVSPLTFERIMFNEGEPRVAATAGRVEITY